MNQEKIAQRIRKARLDAGLTQKEVADKLGITYQAISNYERGKNRIEVNILTAMCEMYNTNVPAILKENIGNTNTSNVVSLGDYVPNNRIPILGRIAAGLPIYAEENIEGYTFTEHNGGAEYFALRVKGDSMTGALILDNDIIVVRRQDIVDNGSIAVVLVDDQDATVKRFWRKDNLVTLTPQSGNPIHQPQVYDLRETKINVLGLVVEVKHKVI